MGFACFTPPTSHLLLPSLVSSSSSSSCRPPRSPCLLLPTHQWTPGKLAACLIAHRLHASLSTSLQSFDVDDEGDDDEREGDYVSLRPESKSSTSTTDKKKRRKKKLRPSFYDQTLERWSVKVSSQRSHLPWQGGSLASSSSGNEDGDRTTNPEASGEETRRMRRLDLIVEKLNGGSSVSGRRNSLNVGDSCSDSGNDLIGKQVHGVSLGTRLAIAPWDHGAKGETKENITSPRAGTKQSELSYDDKRAGDGLMDEYNSRVDSLASNTLDDISCLDFGVVGNSSSAAPEEGDEKICKQVVGIPQGARPVMAPWVQGARKQFEEVKLNSIANIKSSKKNAGPIGEDKMPESGALERKLNSKMNGLPKSEFSYEGMPALGTGKESPQVIEKLIASSGDHKMETWTATHHESNAKNEQDKDRSIVDKLKDSMDQRSTSRFDTVISYNDADDAPKIVDSVPLPWQRSDDSFYNDVVRRRSNTELAERTIPEPELRRLRAASLRMKERMTIGPAGVTETIVQTIHQKWKADEVVKLRFEGAPSLNMKRTHDILEMKTGGLVIWRSGRSIVLYRGTTYQLPCVQTYSKSANADSDEINAVMGESCNDSTSSAVNPLSSSRNTSEEFQGDSDIDNLLNELGPRFKDWTGRSPLPVDADLLPAVVPDYKTPFRLLPYKTRNALKDREMTALRRLARTMPPHFALGRNRQHQGLAAAMVKLWERSAIAKIAIKRGIPNTCNDRIAEEIKRLTGGVLLSRNKEYIVFYRGNDFVTPSIREVLMEKEKLAIVHQDEEEMSRRKAAESIISSPEAARGPLVAGTLAETTEAKTRWGNPLSSEDIERLKKNTALAKHASLLRHLERKLAFAQAKVRKAERALAKVQEFLKPADLPTDLETVTDEERSLYRNIGLKMRGSFLLGRRGVFSGTIENIHLSWKHKELAKVLVKGKSFAQVKQIAISLEAESGGVLISLDKTTKGYAIILYRGKNYQRPRTLRPQTLLTRRQALARSIELQRREALNHHISSLRVKIQMLRSQLDKMESDEELIDGELYLSDDDSDDNMEDEGEEAYLETYDSGDEAVTPPRRTKTFGFKNR